MTFQTVVNTAIRDVVAANPGITLDRLEVEVRARVQEKRRSSHDYFMGGGYFYQRVERMVARRRPLLRRLFYRADENGAVACNHYFAPGLIPACFDLSNETDRLVASDYVRERGHDAVADALKRATRGK